MCRKNNDYESGYGAFSRVKNTLHMHLFFHFIHSKPYNLYNVCALENSLNWVLIFMRFSLLKVKILWVLKGSKEQRLAVRLKKVILFKTFFRNYLLYLFLSIQYFFKLDCFFRYILRKFTIYFIKNLLNPFR